MKSYVKTIIATIMCYLILLTSFPITAIPVFAAEVSLPGDGTESSPYLVHNEEEFIYAMINYGNNQDCYISLKNDITVNSYTPNLFSAHFNGNNNSITSTTNIATTNGGTITNLVFFNNNSYNNVAAVGGLCSTNTGTISNTIVHAQIENAYDAAIISFENNGSILNCAAFGTVHTNGGSDSSWAAGISVRGSGIISNCYTVADITATGSTRYSTSKNHPISIYGSYKNSYFDSTVYKTPISNGYSSNYMKSADFISVLNENIIAEDSEWAIDTDNKNDGYPILKTAYNATITASKTNYLIEGNESVELYFDDGIDVYYTLDGSTPDNNSTKYNSPIEINDTTTIIACGYKNGLTGKTSKFQYAKINGEGTEHSPYIIDCEAAFRGIDELPKTAHYKMTCDIKLTSEFSSFDSFYGAFDGDSHIVSNVYSVLKDKYNCGIFRRNYGIINNLKISTNNKNFYSDGGITYLNYGVISNCFFEGNIIGYVGSNSYSTDGGKTLIKDEKYTQSNVDYYGIGGMVGHNYGVINNSAYAGNVRTKQGNTVGGFVGVNTGTIANCKYTGNIRVDVVFFGSSYQYSNIAAGFAGLNATTGSIVDSTADTNSIFLSTDNAYTGAQIYSFCKNTGSIINCLNSNTNLSLERGYIEWGSTATNTQTFDGAGYSEPEHIHNYKLNMTNPTCTETGASNYVCEECGDSFEYNEIPALGHDYVLTVVPPTYEEQGYTIRNCTRCDLNEQIDFVEPLKIVTDSCGENVNYTFDTGTGILTISGTGAMTAYSSATTIPWYSDRKLVKKVVIEEGVTSICSNSFKDCSNLTEIDIASTVLSFGSEAFYGCSNLTKTTYQGSVNEWASISFSTLYSNPISYSRNLYINNEEITKIELSEGITQIKQYAFVFLNSVKKVVIPESVENIETYAFNWCSNIQEIKMPCSAVCADNYSFYGWSWLSKVTLTKGNGTMDSSLSSYGPWCYSKSGLTTLVLSDGIESICSKAFYNCINLANITFPNNPYSLGGRALSGTKWMENRVDENGFYILGNELVDASFASGSVTIPDGITEIGEYAFAGNGNITEVIIPDSVSTIGDYAFQGCGITKLTIPCSFNNFTINAFSGCTTIISIRLTQGTGIMPDYNTADCDYKYTPWYYSASSLKAIELEDGITNIGKYAFYQLTKLNTVTIPNSVITIDNSAFALDTGLSKIVLPDSIKTINTRAFGGCTGLKELSIPCSATIAADTSTFGNCTNIEKITLTKGTGTMPSFYSNYKCTPWYISRAKLTELIIEDGITNIGAHMFNGNTSIVSITMPSSITTIGANAFYGCTNLSSISVSENLSEIGTYAFYNCTKLNSFDFPNKLETIGTYAFTNSGITSVILGSSVNNIQTAAFSGCNSLTNVYLLNKDCTIAKATTTLPTSAVLYGYGGSTLEAYATKNSRTFVEIYGACPQCGSYDMSRVITEPTCTEQGYSSYSCNSCTHSFIDDYTEAKGHTVVVDEAVAPTCTETGLTEGSHCSVCGIVLTAQTIVSATGHTVITDTAVAPTCTETGLTEGSHCSVCNEVFVAQQTVKALGHSYEMQVTKIATCTSTGTRTYTCNRCGEKYTEVIPMLEHTVVKDKSIAATCTEAGKTEGSHCSVCGTVLVAQETIPATGHNYDDGVVTTEPTCINSGVRTYTCSFCGNTRTETIKAHGHNIVNDAAVPATCTSDGVTAGSHCSICGEVFNEQQTIPALGHSWDNGKITKKATCTAAGVKTFTCSVCAATKAEPIAATGHTEVIDEAIEPNCTETGLTEGSHCSTCGQVLIEQAIIPALGHKEVKDNAVAATCTKDGLTEGTHCSVCDAVLVEREVVPAKGHTEVTDEAVAPTCTETGLTEGIHCSVCSTIITPQEIVPAIGHSKVVDEAVAPTCTETGLTEGYHCSVCDEILIEQEVIPALGHKEVIDKAVATTCTETGLTEGSHCSVCNTVFTEQEIVPVLGHNEVADAAIAATCTQAGRTAGSHCSVCGEIIIAQIDIPSKGHTWNDGEVTKEPSCTDEGEKTFTCSVCGATRVETLSKLEHDVIIDKVVAPTCTETGLTEGSHCGVCGEILVEQEQIDAVGHKWNDGVVIKEATYDEVGEKQYTCLICGETKTEAIAKLEHRGKFVASHIYSRADRNISVEVYIDENPGITSLSIDVAYPEGFTLTSVTDEKLFSDGISKGVPNSNPFTISWHANDSSDSNNTGLFVTLNFTIAEGLSEADYPIDITYNPENIFNHEFENVGFDVENGMVTIIGTIPGDINRDDDINMKDIVLLQQYINKWDVIIDEDAADVNDDGRINMKDIVLLQQYINGWDVVLK